MSFSRSRGLRRCPWIVIVTCKAMVESKEKYSVRAAGIRDARGIAALINSAFQVEKFFVSGDRITEIEVTSLLDKGRFLLADDGSGLAGCVYLEIQAQQAYLGLLSVRPERQRKGIGRLLVDSAEDHARGAGCAVMCLRTVNLRTELPVYYGNLGYKVSGTEPFPDHVPTKQPCHFIVMTKPLGYPHL